MSSRTKFTEIRGILEDEEGQRPFVLRRSAPKRSRAGDYFCVIDLGAVATIPRNAKIYGISASQAKELSNEFVRKMLAGKRLTRKNGKRIAL